MSVQIESRDGKIFTVSLEILNRSSVFSRMSDLCEENSNQSEVIELKNYNSNEISKVIEWLIATTPKGFSCSSCTNVVCNGECGCDGSCDFNEHTTTEWEKIFFDQDFESLCLLQRIADFLDIPPLESRTCSMLANYFF